MKYLIKVGNWWFEVKQVRAIKTPEFHLPYTATALITIVNGKPGVENLLSVDGFTRQDYKDIEQFFNIIGFESADWQRFNKTGKAKKRVR
jgi:hypothetical protein